MGGEEVEVGVCARAYEGVAQTPHRDPPYRGRETSGAACEGRGVDSLPLRCAPAGNDTERVTLRVKLGVIPGERSEGRGSRAGSSALFPFAPAGNDPLGADPPRLGRIDGQGRPCLSPNGNGEV